MACRRITLFVWALLAGWSVSCGGSSGEGGSDGGEDSDGSSAAEAAGPSSLNPGDSGLPGAADVAGSGVLGTDAGLPQGGLGSKLDGAVGVTVDSGTQGMPGGGLGSGLRADAATPIRSTLSDGTVGSSCGTCGPGLTCITTIPGGYCTRACQTSAECGPGASCHDDGGLACFRDCTQDSQCREGYACLLDKATNTKVCYPQATSGAGGAAGTSGTGAAGAPGTGGTTGAPGTGGATGATSTRSTLSDGTVGSSCGTCGPGLTCIGALPGGYCTRTCQTSTECGAGASCHDDGGLVCFRDCTQDSQCREGYSCLLDQATQTKVCYPQTSGGTGGAGGASGTGGTAGTGGGSSTLSDGSVGSSCGTCAPGLSCLSGAQIPGGYCSKACSGGGECGSGASCHYDAGSYLCMRNCNQDTECRSGYVCKLDSTTQTKICYPGGQSPGGTGSGNAQLRGCYWRNRDITYRLYFDGVGSFQEPMYNPVSGSITYSGRYQVSGTQLILQYSDGTTKTYPLQVSGNSVYIVDGSATYAYAEAACS